MNTAVVIFIYKRPELTQEIFEVLKVVKPSKLFIFSNGPQVTEEMELCNRARAVFDDVDWTADVYRDYLPTNIGLGKRITSGLDYVFSQVDRAIILEDDCIPSEQFFLFCEEMLDRYHDDEKVMHITGTNLLANHSVLKNYEYGYFFSRFSMPWGWASWASSWKKFNHDYTTFKHHGKEVLSKLNKENVTVFKTAFSSCEYFFDAWDVQWLTDILFHDGFVISPTSNLIKNKGNDIHSSYMPEFSSFLNLDLEQLTNLKNPPLSLNEILNNQCENAFIQLMNDFTYHGHNKDKKFEKTQEILKFLNPIIIEKELDFSEIKELVLKTLPPYTILPLDFFESVFNFFPKYSKLNMGAWVEVGVWKGGGALILRSLMNELEINQPLYLYDTFGEVSINKLKHSEDLEFLTGFGFEKEKISKANFLTRLLSFFKRTSIEPTFSYLSEVKDLFVRFDLNSNVKFIPSDVHLLSQNQIPANISFLFIDVDFYEPVYRTLELFYDKLIPGGILIIDDYYLKYLNCRDAVNDFFQLRNIDLSKHSNKFSSYSILIIKP